MAAGRAGSTSVDTDGTEIFTSAQGTRATTIKVKNAGTTNNLLVRVYPLHGVAEFDVLAPGQVEYYRCGNDAIKSVFAKAASSTTTANHAVVAILFGY